jgi:transposase
MLSAANIKAIKEAGYHFIIGSRLAKTPYEIVEYEKTEGQELKDGQIFDMFQDMNTGSGVRYPQRAIYQYRSKRAAMDLLNIDKLLTKAKNMVAGKAEFKRNRFLKVSGSKREINYELVESSRLRAGIKGYITDLDIAPQEVIDAYHQLFQIERSFRMSKSDLKARPIFHHKRDSIEAHLTVVFAVLAISRVIQAKTGISIKKLLNTLGPIRTGRLSIAGKQCIIQPRITSEAKELLEKVYG